MAFDDPKDKGQAEPGFKTEAIEPIIMDLERRIEKLKTDFILYFSGEIKLPPEKERETVEKAVNHVQLTGAKSARVNLLIQNLASRFSLFNNMWLKRMNEVETGMNPRQRSKRSPTQAVPEVGYLSPSQMVSIEVPLSAADAKTYDALYDQYKQFASGKVEKLYDKEILIKSMKEKMSSFKLTDANVVFSYSGSKVSIKLKKKV
jgi:hypothetical protein